ncbi:uncharacterized protein PAC_15071 [Phialocephala subalpina]|uniref:Uncharacterized protein n=1 Tax=Phialocephala subalpina TaxID=576137 RepID=A0A1L7XJF3_9HELO|nr:uncharacterized protein PAC_15071 [Phialocephala subalpina]
MCTGMTLAYSPCDHRTTHYSTKCTDAQCTQHRLFPITFVNGYCMACIGSDESSRSSSFKTVETVGTDVSSDVKAIGDKLDTLIQSCGAIAGVVNSEAQRRASVTKPVKVAQLAREVELGPSDIKVPISNTIITKKEYAAGNLLTQDITAPIISLQEDLDKHLQFWRNALDEAVERQMAVKVDLKTMKECLHASYQWLDDHTGKAFEEAEKQVASRCQERTYLVGSFIIMVFFFGFFFGFWFNNVWLRV